MAEMTMMAQRGSGFFAAGVGFVATGVSVDGVEMGSDGGVDSVGGVKTTGWY